LSDADHEVAGRLLVSERRLRGVDVLEREGFGNHRLEPAFVDEGDELVEVLDGAQGGPEEVEMLEIQGA
jgi:hypothetical protein